MSAQGNAAPVIIKRKKIVAGGGHHGGAWKVAYADFVTAMMAFFLLMWLLNATTEKQRKGLADYFSPNVPISRVSGGGEGQFGGESVFTEDTLPRDGIGATEMRPTETIKSRGESGLAVEDGASAASTEDEIDRMKESFDKALQGMSGESMAAKDLLEHIVTRVTDEGLVVEVFDLEDAGLFGTGTAEPTELMQGLAGVLVELGALVSNNVAVEGHVRAAPVVLIENPVWDLSSARANVARQLLEEGGFEPARLHRVTGHADREPAVTDPMAKRNNRLEVIFLR